MDDMGLIIVLEVSSMLVERLEELNMHDSEIIGMPTEKIHEGRDVILDLQLKYIISYEPFEVVDKILRFSNCYKIIADMNFWTIPRGNILKADTYGLEKVEELLGSKVIEVLKPPKLKCCKIEMNTCGSVIWVVAETIQLLDV